MKPLLTHAAMAQRYFGWARSQGDLADKALSPKVREDHLALAEYYLKLGDDEVAAANCASAPQIGTVGTSLPASEIALSP